MKKTIFSALSILALTITLKATTFNIEYDIDNKNSVVTALPQDENSGLFFDFPLELVKYIAISKNISKDLYGLSKGFRALHLSGFLPLKIKFDGLKHPHFNHERTSAITPEDIFTFRNIQNLTICNLELFVSKSLPEAFGDFVLPFLNRFKNVSAFANIQTLVLWDLPLVDDVSALGNVRNLTLEDMGHLDMSMLGQNGQKLTVK